MLSDIWQLRGRGFCLKQNLAAFAAVLCKWLDIILHLQEVLYQALRLN